MSVEVRDWVNDAVDEALGDKDCVSDGVIVKDWLPLCVWLPLIVSVSDDVSDCVTDAVAVVLELSDCDCDDVDVTV